MIVESCMMNNSTTQVQSLYERHPYPHYPLLAKPRWQDGYLGSSLFANHLINRRDLDPTKPRQFLSFGCGEILPYIIRQWEPPATQLTCIDLSARSLRRAQFRTSLLGRHTMYHQVDINEYFSSSHYVKQKHSTVFDHVDAYGVLHHISSWATTLNLVRQHMAPHAIFRIMVYNAKARDWIWDLNRAFRLLGLEFSSNQDVADARNLLKQLATMSPRLRERLQNMGESSLENNTRFADTFLHPWESRASVQQWFDAFGRAQLKPMALHDRYGELDDLQNPLWRCPTAAELTERIDDLRFENNLEIWLVRDDHQMGHTCHVTPKISTSSVPFRLRSKLPPTSFNKYSETRDMSLGAKLIVWHGFLKAIYNREDPIALKFIADLDLLTAARLARLGLILPETAESLGIYNQLLRPIHKSMAAPILPLGFSGRIDHLLHQITVVRKISPEKSLLAAKRLLRAM